MCAHPRPAARRARARAAPARRGACPSGRRPPPAPAPPRAARAPPPRAPHRRVVRCVRALCGLCVHCGVLHALSRARYFHCDVMCNIYTDPTRRNNSTQHPGRRRGPRAGWHTPSHSTLPLGYPLGLEAREPGGTYAWCVVSGECRDLQRPCRTEAAAPDAITAV